MPLTLVAATRASISQLEKSNEGSKIAVPNFTDVHGDPAALRRRVSPSYLGDEIADDFRCLSATTALFALVTS